MPLRIRTVACRNPDELRTERNEDGFPDLDDVTKAVGFTMYWARIDRITQANSGEVFRRLQAAERIEGPRMFYGGEPQWFTAGDVERRVGLTVNCTPKSKRVFDKEVREAEEEMKKDGQLPYDGWKS